MIQGFPLAEPSGFALLVRERTFLSMAAVQGEFESSLLDFNGTNTTEPRYIA
jgi:hypothetical protein